MKQFKLHDERFCTYYIRPEIIERDLEGYGKVKYWDLFDKEDKLIHRATKLTEARLMARKLSNQNKQNEK